MAKKVNKFSQNQVQANIPTEYELKMNVDMLNGAILPGVFHLQKGYNAYKGKPFFEGAQSNKDLFKFTFNEGRYTSGNNDYLVPDQVDMPPLSYMCEFSERASEVVMGDSTEFMEAQQKSISKGGGLNAGIQSEKFSFGASTSFQNSNSSAREASRSAKNNSMEKQIYTSAIATLYTYALREGKEYEFLNEEFKNDIKKVRSKKEVYWFFSLYGTHYLKRAKMGARFQENIYLSNLATESEVKDIRNEANKDSFTMSAGFGIKGFGFKSSYS